MSGRLAAFFGRLKPENRPPKACRVGLPVMGSSVRKPEHLRQFRASHIFYDIMGIGRTAGIKVIIVVL